MDNVRFETFEEKQTRYKLRGLDVYDFVLCPDTKYDIIFRGRGLVFENLDNETLAIKCNSSQCLEFFSELKKSYDTNHWFNYRFKYNGSDWDISRTDKDTDNF